MCNFTKQPFQNAINARLTHQPAQQVQGTEQIPPYFVSHYFLSDIIFSPKHAALLPTHPTYLPEDRATSFRAMRRLSPSTYAKDKLMHPTKINGVEKRRTPTKWNAQQVLHHTAAPAPCLTTVHYSAPATNTKESDVSNRVRVLVALPG